MFDYIQGKLREKGPGYAVVENGGLGFYLQVPLSSCDKLKPGAEVKFFTRFTIVRGELPVLYGFINPQQRLVFNSILNISGIGPRLAMNILGSFSLSQLSQLIVEEEVERLVRVPKLGPKKARLLIIELSDKLPSVERDAQTQLNFEAEQALIALGYNKKEAIAAIAAVSAAAPAELGSEELVRLALKNLTLR